MSAYDIFVSQLLDPFRIGLLIVLLGTTQNTMAHTGRVLPVAAGILFVAVLIPLTFTPQADNWWSLVAVGLLTNAVIVGLALLAWLAYRRLAAAKDGSS